MLVSVVFMFMLLYCSIRTVIYRTTCKGLSVFSKTLQNIEEFCLGVEGKMAGLSSVPGFLDCPKIWPSVPASQLGHEMSRNSLNRSTNTTERVDS